MRREGRILRVVRANVREDVLAFLDSPVSKSLVAEDLLIDSRVLSPAEGRALIPDIDESEPLPLVLEHPAIPFPSFPYEWCPEMLLAAGRLTLSIALRLLDDGLGLKDASAYNVLFRWGKPVFVDLLSLERRSPGDSRWLAYAQFQRNFNLPLLASRYYGLNLAQAFLTYRDGLEPETIYRLVGPIRKLLPPFLGLVSLPTWLGRRGGGPDVSAYSPPREVGADKARFILGALLRQLQRQLEAVRPLRSRVSVWSGYMEAKSYSERAFLAKDTFVREALVRERPQRVLDIGCNTGHFSLTAARHGADVVAIDTDPVVVGRLYSAAVPASLHVLPLVIDIARPSPGLGWRNQEQRSFIERAQGGFDMVLALAVLHHFLVTERIPLDDVLSLLAELTRKTVIVEFVAPEDPMFRRLSRGRDHLFRDLTREMFERTCRRYFHIVQSVGPVDETRWLYLLGRGGLTTS
jgi:SAM-dependent methyltransferase